ncbi:MAG TPA: hypothetical protein VM686_36455 [Polyangiaceae bacterium]|nr:hypothetical protein [Polyangiaceae bacterium]
MSQSWIEDEPGLPEAARELEYLASRARARVFWLVPLALTLSIAGALFLSTSPPSFKSRVVIKVSDDNVESGEVRLARQDLLNKLNNTVFTRASLLRLMQQFGLDPGSESGRDLALKDLREEIELEVIQDYFPGPNQTLRSATHIVLSYSAGDAELALNVARALGGIVTTAASGERHTLASGAAESVGTGAAVVRAELQRSEDQRAQLLERLATLSGEERAAALLELKRAKRSTRWQESQLEQLTKQHSELSLHDQFDQKTLSLHFEVLDPGHLAPPPFFTPKETLVLAFGFLILFTLPWCGMLLGLIDGRVEDERQLKRLGLRSLGHIPAFGGYQLGSYRARTEHN